MPEYNYSEAEIRNRVKSGKDAKRAAGTERLIAQATQPPHEDDAAAMQQLTALAGDDSTGGYATNDARNYVRFRLGQIGGPKMQYSEARDGGGLLGSLGDVLKIAAPIASFAVPGLGVLGAGALAAGGSAAGGLLKGEDFDLKDTLLAGVAGGAGNALLGNQGIRGITGIPSRLGLTGAKATGNTTAGGLVGETARSPGVLGKVGDFLGGGDTLDKIMKANSIYELAKSQRKSDRLSDDAVEGATKDYDDRRPLRDMAKEGILNLPNVERPDLSHIYEDKSNPYFRPPPPLTPGPAAPAGVRALTDRYAQPRRSYR